MGWLLKTPRAQLQAGVWYGEGFLKSWSFCPWCGAKLGGEES
jgi:hypothetical protein